MMLKGMKAMREIHSNIEGKQYHLFKLEQLLKPMGYTIGGIGIMIMVRLITKLIRTMVTISYVYPSSL